MRRFLIALLFVLLPSWSAQADLDIPGVVIVDDDDDVLGAIAYASSIGTNPQLGAVQNRFICDLEDGDSDCRTMTVDTATDGSVVITVLRMHQPNLLDHRGNEAYVKQKKLAVRFVVLDNLIDQNEIGASVETVVAGCKGKSTVLDRNGDDAQDKAAWVFSCRTNQLAPAVASIAGGDAVTAQAAVNEVLQAVTIDGVVRVKGRIAAPPSDLGEPLDSAL